MKIFAACTASRSPVENNAEAGVWFVKQATAISRGCHVRMLRLLPVRCDVECLEQMVRDLR
jgi:hypothetical protein